MIQHVVMLKARETEVLSGLMRNFAALVGRIEGFTAFAHGPNIDAEQKSPDYPYGFICTFTDRAALDRYAADARHQALGAQLVSLCDGGGEGIMVYDIAQR